MLAHTIREIAESDAAWIFEACQDQQIQYWTTVPRPYLLEHAEAFVNGELPEYKIWVIENNNAKPVGLISIHEINESGEASLGYFVAPWGRGNGAGSDAIRLVENWAKDNSEVNSLVACISDLNTFSQRVAEEAGLQKSEVADRTCPAGENQTTATFYRKTL